jgi:glc operon protein GlcG
MKARPVLTHSDALLILNAIRAVLEAQNKGAAVAVSDEHGELIALVRTDGCPLPSINNAINKESKEIGRSSKEKGWPMTNFGDLRYTAWGGGVPIFHEGVCVGAVGVSGLPEEEDIVLARLGVKALE